MTSDNEEGASFIAAFKASFGNSFGTVDKLKQRDVAERQAAPRRARIKGPPKTQKVFRATDETIAQIKALRDHLDKFEGDVIAMAIAELHTRILEGKKP